MTSVIKVDTIQNSSGTSALSIGAGGEVTTQGAFLPGGLTAWPAFLVSGDNAAWRSYSAEEAFQFNDATSGNALFDSGSNFNTTTYTFTAPIDGIYSFGLNIYTLENASEGRGAISINGTRASGAGTLKIQVRESTNLDMTGYMSLTLNLSAGDEIQAVSDNAASFYIKHSFFTGHLVAPL